MVNSMSSLKVTTGWSIRAEIFYESHFLGQILVCVYTICHLGQILVSCTIPNGSFFPPSHAYYCASLVQVCCIHLYDQPFRLCHRITYTCYSVDYYQFLFWHIWFLWRYFRLLFKEIQFLYWGFHFLATSESSYGQFSYTSTRLNFNHTIKWSMNKPKNCPRKCLEFSVTLEYKQITQSWPQKTRPSVN